MTVDAPTRERLVLDRLRETYEHQGYEFFVNPLSDMLPSFLGNYRPDAIALKQGEGVIIEVKHGRRPGQDPQLEALARLVSGQPGWKLQVYFEREQPEDSVRIVPATQLQVDAQITEAERLAAAGHCKAALLLAWSVLEAIARAQANHEGTLSQRPFSPAQTVQSLEMAGLVDREVGRDLRATAQLRNLIAHGDLGVDVNAHYVERMIKHLRDLSAAATIPSRSGD